MPCPFKPGQSDALTAWVVSAFHHMNPGTTVTPATKVGSPGLGYTAGALGSFVENSLIGILVSEGCKVVVPENVVEQCQTVGDVANAIGAGLK